MDGAAFLEVDHDDLVPATLSWLHEMDHQFGNYLEDERGPSASQLRLRNLSSDTLPVWRPKVTRRNVGFTPGGLWQGGRRIIVAMAQHPLLRDHPKPNSKVFSTHSYKPLGIWNHPENWWNEQACPLINTILF